MLDLLRSTASFLTFGVKDCSLSGKEPTKTILHKYASFVEANIKFITVKSAHRINLKIINASRRVTKFNQNKKNNERSRKITIRKIEGQEKIMKVVNDTQT